MVASRWSRWITTAAVLLLALIAAVVSYSHMYELALRHGEPAWRAALFPLSVDGMVVAASMALLSDARQGRRGGFLPWSLLIIGSVASLAANIAVADPSAWSRIIHAWPSFALIGSYELLMRQFRANSSCTRTAHAVRTQTGDDQADDDHPTDTTSEPEEPRNRVPRLRPGATGRPVLRMRADSARHGREDASPARITRVRQPQRDRRLPRSGCRPWRASRTRCGSLRRNRPWSTSPLVPGSGFVNAAGRS